MCTFPSTSTKPGSKSGFSLIELLVVVAIIGILAVGISGIDFNKMGNRQKRDRFANAIVSMFRSEITKNSTGKAIRPNGIGSFVFPTKSLVILGNGEIRTEYYSGSTVASQHAIVSKPFFGDDKYQLKNGTWSAIGGTTVPISFETGATLVMELKNGAEPVLYYSGSSVPQYLVSAQITLGYDPEFVNISIDRRNGLVTY